MKRPFGAFASWDPMLTCQPLDFGLDAFSEIQDEFATNMGSAAPIQNSVPLPPSNGEDSEPFPFPDPSLPSNDVAEVLIELFFRKLYHVLPCFHKGTFLEEYRSGRLQTESPILLYSIISVAASFHPDPIIKSRRSDWYEQAKLLYDITGRAPEFPLRTMQAVTFLVYHAYTCGDFSACWLYIGKAWRQASASGMNRMDSKHALIIPLGLKDHHDDEHYGYYNRTEWVGRTVRQLLTCKFV